jgi:hypothetical protein
VPAALDPGQNGQFVVELHGSQELATADLSNVAAFREGLSKPLQIARKDVSKSTDSAVVRLVFALSAPSEAGAFSVTVNLPGIADLPDVGLVVPK